MSDAARAILESNLAALAPRDGTLAGAIRAAVPDPRVTHVTARNGAIVPAVLLPRGTLPLHSLYDPLGESRKLVRSVQGSGCYVVFGLGAGFHVSALLEDPGVFSLVIIEKDAAVLRGLLGCAALGHVLSDPRVHLVVGFHAIPPALSSFWQPALMGGLRTVALRPWCECEQDFFEDAAEAVQSGIAGIRADYSVQAHFARRWTSNIVSNMDLAERASPPLPRGERAIVTAAGPSLDSQIAGIARERATNILIATDTSLPALLRTGLRPDAVISIDCQAHSYHHFQQGIPGTTVLFCDLASPASVTRRTRNTAFIAGGHPLVSWLCSRWKRLPRIDMSGGNVTHAALSLAQFLGASRIRLCGADFSYPRGSMYARGTYLHDLFMSTQGRLSPAESQWFAFLFRSSDTRREIHGDRVLYTTTLLLAYRERLLRLMENMEADVIPDTGEGLSLAHRKPLRNTAALSSLEAFALLPPAKPLCGWREALDAYARALDDLSIPSDRPGAWFRSLSAAQAEILSTLLPVTASVLKERGEGFPGPAAIEGARQWTLQRIRRALGSGAP